MNIITSITVLGFLIFFHESGHFLAAILQGIKVDGFSIGFGPALIQKEINGINYSIRAFPLGGFVSFPEEKSKYLINNDPELLKNRPVYQRIIVISAGVLANLILAYILLFGNSAISGLPPEPDKGISVIAVQPNEAASIAGLEAGDKILSLNDEELGKGESAVNTFVKAIQESSGDTLKIVKSNNNNIETISLTPKEYKGKGKIGAQLNPNVSANNIKTNNLFKITSYSNKEFISLLSQTIEGYKGLITNFGSTAQQLSGPVKIVEIGAQLSEQGGKGIILFASLISINLAVLNSLPFPLLDGGQLIFTMIEGISGKPIPSKLEAALTQSGFLVLAGLSIVLIIKDTTQLIIEK
tara:strand:- start:398 stop:1462 length:1065 start_codon:yes stop_codon:yes gene_type:complete